MKLRSLSWHSLASRSQPLHVVADHSAAYKEGFLNPVDLA